MNPDKTPYKILQILKDGYFHSEENLSQVLNTTAHVICSGIQQLTTHYGLDIQSLPGRGYRIKGGLTLLDQSKILAYLPPSKRDGLHLTVLNQTTSTNDHLLKTTNNGHHQNLPYHVVVAEQQTQGRGRQGKPWHSPYGNNVYFSLGWRCHKNLSELSGLSLAAGIAIIRSLHQLGIQDLGVKWPNDIYYHHKKLAGVLIDLVSETTDQTLIIIGIGMNTYLSHQATTRIDQPCISLHDITGDWIDRNRLIAKLTEEVIIMTQQFAQHHLAPFRDEWDQYDYFKDQPVILCNHHQKIQGVMRGITEHGELLLEDDQRCIKKYINGELSLRAAT